MAVLNERYPARLESPSRGRAVAAPDSKTQLREYGLLVRATVSRLSPGADGFSADPQSGVAMIDTGADFTCLDRRRAELAGLASAGEGAVDSATQRNQAAPRFEGRLRIDGLGRSFDLRRADGLDLQSFGLVAVIGRDILEECVLVYNGPDGSFSLSI